MRTVEIYGKSQQSAKPDWQHRIQFPFEVSLDLSEQYFTRNQSLLSGNLTLPSNPVIKWVLAFAELSNAQKTEALPHIDLALRKSTLPADDHISAATQAWFAQLIALDGPDIRKASIWLSRYCLNPQATIQQLSPTTSEQKAASASSRPVSGHSSPPDQTTENMTTQNMTTQNMTESPFPPYAGPIGKPPSAHRIVAASEGRRRFQIQT